jgi:hypothetical protein
MNINNHETLADPQQVDWRLVRAKMNGFDFNHRVLKPWARDLAFYQSIKTAFRFHWLVGK